MKTIIITGTSRGLGKAFFDLLKETDNTLVCVSRSFPEDQTKSDRVHPIQLDLGNLNDIAPALSDIPIDDEVIFISNAGIIAPLGPTEGLDSEAIQTCARVNFTAPCLITQYLAKKCKEKHIPLRIFNISSGAALSPIGGWAMYCAVKAGAKMFFDVVGQEEGIEIQNIDPGVMETGMQADVRAGNFPNQAFFQRLSDEKILKDPKEVAQGILSRGGLL